MLCIYSILQLLSDVSQFASDRLDRNILRTLLLLIVTLSSYVTVLTALHKSNATIIIFPLLQSVTKETICNRRRELNNKLSRTREHCRTEQQEPAQGSSRTHGARVK